MGFILQPWNIVGENCVITNSMNATISELRHIAWRSINHIDVYDS